MKTILIADDRPTGREWARAVLEDAGYKVVEATNGQDAVHQARTARPDLILLDLHMPGLDGYQVVGALRDSADFAATPIVALTASAMQGDRERALTSGFTSYLAKPIKISTLKSEVERLLA